jgi:4-hydroxy-4-methyl-2-oxoglutarate aldolase
MFKVNYTVPALDLNLIEAYRHFDTALIGHRLTFGYAGTPLRLLGQPARVIGRAVTVRVQGIDSTIVHYVTDYLQPGDVLVIDMAGEEIRAPFGGGIAQVCKNRGAVAAIIAGAITDSSEIQQLNFPVWYQAVSAVTTKVQGNGGEMNTPVKCGLAEVHPGDLVIADNDGVFFLRPELAVSMVEEFNGMLKRQADWNLYFETGQSLPERSGAKKLVEEKLLLVAKEE